MVWAIGGLPKCRKFTCSGHTFQGCSLLLILMMVSTQKYALVWSGLSFPCMEYNTDGGKA